MPTTTTRVATFSTWGDEYDDRTERRTRHAGTAVDVGGMSFTVDSPATAQEVCAIVNRLADDPEQLHRLAAYISTVAFRLKAGA